MPARPKPKGKPKQQEAGEGFVYGPADETYSVSDIPMLKQRIANNPASAGILQPIIDRLEAGDFDTPWGPPDDDPTITPGDPTDTPPGATNQEDINAAIAAAMEAAGIGKDFDFSDFMTAADAEELFKNTLPIDYETLQKMGEKDWMPENWTPTMQAMIDESLGNNYIDQATLDAQLAGYPSAAEIQKLLEEQGWGALGGDPFGGALSGYSTTAAIQQMIKDNLALGLSEDAIYEMIKDAFGETMSDDDIYAAIATAQDAQYTSLMDEVQKLIADSLAQGMSEEEILALIQAEYGDQMSPEDIQNAIATAQQGIYDTMMAEVNALIAQALTDGLSPEQIAEMIKEQFGDQMTDDEILTAIADAQAGVPTIQEIEAMIAQALLDGVSPEDIAIMISDYVGDSGLLSADDIATMIADAIAGIGTTTGGDALTSDAVQQMIDAAITGLPAGLSTEDVQAMLGESGYMGDTGVQGLIDAALQGSLGEGGSISQAIQAALAATGGGAGTGTDIDTGTYTSPYGTYTSPYGDVDPYALMHNPWYGTTPFAGGTTTGAEDPTGLGDLDLGNPANYNFDISTEYDEDLFS
jgi:DNA-binding transcriptional regulator YhcF (GntR family)